MRCESRLPVVLLVLELLLLEAVVNPPEVSVLLEAALHSPEVSVLSPRHQFGLNVGVLEDIGPDGRPGVEACVLVVRVERPL